jgi:hypothetical protein
MPQIKVQYQDGVLKATVTFDVVVTKQQLVKASKISQRIISLLLSLGMSFSSSVDPIHHPQLPPPIEHRDDR